MPHGIQIDYDEVEKSLSKKSGMQPQKTRDAIREIEYSSIDVMRGLTGHSKWNDPNGLDEASKACDALEGHIKHIRGVIEYQRKLVGEKASHAFDASSNPL